MRRAGGFTLVLFALVGCGDGVATLDAPPSPPAPRTSCFDPAKTGGVAGRVRWAGPIPVVPPIDVERFIGTTTKVEHLARANPHAPNIDPASGALAGVVVFLRGVDPTAARPWDLPPVTVEVRDDGPIVRQGNDLGLIGLVHRGDKVTMVSKQPAFHSLRARGAAFFTLTLPDAEKPRTRVLNEVGQVELSSAAGHPAMRGHLFVDDHPYYAVTDADGRFLLPQVPAGTYDLVCWRPDWRVERQERDPETLLRVRLFFHPARETVVTVSVRIGETATVGMEVE